VEVGLVMPIFILTLCAVIEFGYFVAVDSAIRTASREGARFGSTVDDEGGTPNYLDCDAIRDRVRELVGPLVTLDDADIDVGYDTNDAGFAKNFDCSPALDPDDIDPWFRVVVTVNHTYLPVTPVLSGIIGEQEMVSVDRRSIVTCDGC
jgi:TadE-like protein